MKKPLLSLCIPTNGVVEWVIPVVESIYNQKVDNSLFEVIITDDGDQSNLLQYLKNFLDNKNLFYYKTKEKLFLNEIACYKKANGEFIKFVNHRNILEDGSIKKFLEFIKKNISEKPIVYFSNGVLEHYGAINIYDNFDNFVKRLSYFSSWSSGMAIWKTDFDNIVMKDTEYNELFPHTDILFSERHKKKYIVDNTRFFEQIPHKETKKGKYDFFYAFGVEYPSIILSLYKDGDIKKETFDYIKYNNLGFIGKSYLDYILLKKETSYDLSGFEKMFGIYYKKTEMYLTIFKKAFWKINKELRKKIGLKY